MNASDADPQLVLQAVLQIRPLGIDEMAAVRHLHTRAFEHHIGPILSSAEVETFTAHVHSPSYADRVFAHDPVGAYLHGELVGTVGSQRTEDGDRALRITHLFVRPMFGRLGIGRALLTNVEQKAMKSGIFSIALQVTRNATEFFEKHGFQVTSFGIGSISGLGGLAVAFLRKDMLSSQRPIGGEADAPAKRPKLKRAGESLVELPAQSK